jgi:hypothetical protein
MHPLPKPTFPFIEMGFFALSPSGFGGTALGTASRFQVKPRPFVGGCGPLRAASSHDAMPVDLADGSVRLLSANMPPTVWWWACTPFGGEVLPADWQ